MGKRRNGELIMYVKDNGRKKQMRHLRGMLEQVRAYRAMTDYCHKWKEQRSVEIKKEIQELTLQEET